MCGCTFVLCVGHLGGLATLAHSSACGPQSYFLCCYAVLHCTSLCCWIVGVLVALLLVDRVGRLPLLRASSAMAVVVLIILVAAAMMHATKLHVPLAAAAMNPPLQWAELQLSTLAVLSVSVCIHTSTLAVMRTCVLKWVCTRCRMDRDLSTRLCTALAVAVILYHRLCSRM